MDTIIALAMKFIAGLIVVWVHELPKLITVRLVTHPIHRRQDTEKLNPFSFIDPIGLFMFMIMNVGWQKPRSYSSGKYAHKEKGILSVALTGMVTNLLFMALLIPTIQFIQNGYVASFVYYLIFFNFTIVIVNLLPVPPLEMSQIIYSVSPNAYFKLVQNERMIHTVFILLLVIGILPTFIQQLFYTSVGFLLN